MEQMMTPTALTAASLPQNKLKLTEPYRANQDNLRALDQSLQLSATIDGLHRFMACVGIFYVHCGMSV